MALFIAALSLSCELASKAQTPIDPSLPPAPLSNKRAFLFPTFDNVDHNANSKPIPPLSTRQKYELAFRTTVSPSLLIRAEASTMFDRALGVGPFYAPGFKGYAQLYGYNAANLASAFVFSQGVIPALAHQDPRFFQKGSGPVKSRIWWALRSEFVAFGDDGKQMPNYGNMVGLGVSALLSDAYLPDRNVSVRNTFQAYAIKIGTTWGFNIFHEYGGLSLIKKAIHRKSNRQSAGDDSSGPPTQR